MKKPNLIQKIKELLTPKEKKDTYQKAEEMFPNLINYLKKEYGNLQIRNTQNQEMNKSTWFISTEGEEDVIGGGKIVGMISDYIQMKGLHAEYGYQGSIRTGKGFIDLKYREGFHLISEFCITPSNHPLRYDEEAIPFP